MAYQDTLKSDREYYTKNEVNQMLYKQFKDLSEHFLSVTVQDHLNIYHKFLNDNLTVDDLCDSVKKYGVDLEKRYEDLLGTLEEHEDVEND